MKNHEHDKSYPPSDPVKTEAEIAQDRAKQKQRELGIRKDGESHGGPHVDPEDHRRKNERATEQEDAAQPNGGQEGIEPKDHLPPSQARDAVIGREDVPVGGADKAEPKVM